MGNWECSNRLLFGVFGLVWGRRDLCIVVVRLVGEGDGVVFLVDLRVEV